MQKQNSLIRRAPVKFLDILYFRCIAEQNLKVPHFTKKLKVGRVELSFSGIK